MPLRDWGIGLEELTEYYHRYGLRYTDEGINNESQLWIMRRGFMREPLLWMLRSLRDGKFLTSTDENLHN